MNSMTGFGRAEAEEKEIKITVEMKSVNHRFLDLSIRMPRQLSALEDCVRTAVKQRFSRGRIELSVYAEMAGAPEKVVNVDLPLVKGYLKAADAIARSTGVKSKLTMNDLLRLPDVLSFEKMEFDEGLAKGVLLRALEEACAALETVRRAEGERIVADILARVDTLSALVAEIEQREPAVIEEYRTKLRARLEEFLQDTEIDQNRFNQEILYFTDKANVTEEVVRLRSHLAQLKKTLTGSEAAGRGLDFTVQELNREFNTIGSKSADLAITNAVLTAKGEVEKIREQVQNIE